MQPADTNLLNLFSPGLFKGKTVLVTGGGTGIGFAIAKMLGGLGADIVIAARREDVLEAASVELRDLDINARWHSVNTRNQEAVENLFQWIEKEDIALDFLVNNAGGQFPAKALDISPNGFKAVMDLNIQGTWQMTSAFAHRLVESGRTGRVISIVFPHTGANPYFAHAQAARAAVVNLTKSLALEWGKKGILLNTVGPGAIETEALKQYSAEKAWDDPTARLPVPRMGTSMEVAAAVAFLLSPAASYITGVHLPIDGGDTIAGQDPQKQY